MAILYTNIKHDNTLEHGTSYTPFSKKQLIDVFEQCAIESGYSGVEWNDKNESPYQCTIRGKNTDLKLFMYLRNISGAGWEDKPWIKRVQVPNVRLQKPDYYVRTNKNQTFLILGYYNYDSNPIFVAWDAYDYVIHSTIRSCYVSVEDLIVGYNQGLYEGYYAKQKIWVFLPRHFNDFLTRYIDANSY